MKRVLKFAGKVWLYYLILALLMLVFTLGISNLTLRIILDMILVLAFMYLTFSEGGYLGEKGVSNAESIVKQEKEGRRVLDEQRQQVFSVKFAVAFLLIAVLPFWIVAGLNAAYYPTYMAAFRQEQAEQAETVEEEPAQTGGTTVTLTADDLPETDPETGEPVVTESEEEVDYGTPRPQHWARLLAWAVMIPFSGINQLCSDAANAVLFFLYGLLLPGAGFGGYMCGPALHKKKIKDMKKGSRRKRRNLLVHKQPKPPKAVV